MTTEAMTPIALSPAIERALVDGDLSKLTAEDKATLYRQTCESLGLQGDRILSYPSDHCQQVALV